MTLKELNSMSRKELENILITCDGCAIDYVELKEFGKVS